MKKPPPPPPAMARPAMRRHDPMARLLAKAIRDGHGQDQAATFDQSEHLGAPRGWVGTRNMALDRALGCQMPLGRFVEIFGKNASGKSTVADQIGAECQAAGGLYAVADVERNRDRPYMRKLGVNDEATVWVGGETIEQVFEEMETFARSVASSNVMAWHQALAVAGVDPGKLNTYLYKTYDPRVPKKDRAKSGVVGKYTMAEWSASSARALSEYQAAQQLRVSGICDPETRAHLQPLVFYTEEGEVWAGDIRSREYKDSLEAARSGEVGPLAWHAADRPVVFTWDSIGATAPRVEASDMAGDFHPGLAAQINKRNLRRLVQLLDRAAILVVLVNQVYHKIESGPGAGRGPSTDTPGGEGIKFAANMRVEITRVGKVMESSADNALQIGQICRAFTVKNKVQAPFRSEDFAIIYGRGADNAWAIYADCVTRGIIKAASGWSRFTDPTLGTTAWQGGWQQLANMMAEDSSLWVRLAALYREGAR